MPVRYARTCTGIGLPRKNDLARHGRDRFQRPADLRAVFILEQPEDAFRAGQHFSWLDAFALGFEQAAFHLGGREGKNVRQIERRDVARHERFRDDLFRVDMITRLHQHVAGDRQNAADSVSDLSDDFQTGCVSGHALRTGVPECLKDTIRAPHPLT